MKRLLLLAFVACGPKTPPTTLEPPVANADAAAPPANPIPVPDAGVEDAAPTIAPSATTEAPKPPPDECTPIGVELEKKVRPKLRECYREGKKKDPDLKGNVKITIDVDTLGKAKDPRILENTLPKPVGECMLKAVKDAKLAPADAAKCPGKSITIPIAFPTPK